MQEVLGQTKQKLQCHHPSPLQNKLEGKTGPQKYPEVLATFRAKSTFGKINPHFLVNERYKHLGFYAS